MNDVYVAHCDSWLKVGLSHEVCEDYALTGVSADGQHYAIISDGCSSVPHANEGSRLVARCAARYMDKFRPEQEPDYRRLVIHSAANAADFLGLPVESLCATVQVAKTYTDAAGNVQGVLTSSYGDGFVLAKRRSGEIWVVRFRFQHDQPYYMKYELNPDEINHWHETVKWYEQDFEIDEGGYKHDRWQFEGGRFLVGEVKRWPAEDYEWVAVASDGLETFVESIKSQTSITREPLPIEEAITTFCNFKRRKGPFVKACAKRAWAEAQRNKLQNVDDLSLACITLSKQKIESQNEVSTVE